MGITFWLKLFGSAMVALSVLVIIVSIGILMHGIAAVLERLDEKGASHEHPAGDTE